MRIYSHLEHQLTNYQANAVLGAHNFSYLEERVSDCSIEQKMYLMMPLYAPNIQGHIGTGNALLVYQQGQDISFGPVEGNCGRTVGVIPDSHPSTLGAALSFQIQTTIIPGEKMVVIHPGRHHWLESGAESHFFHPMHKSGIFRHTLSYMTTMEIRSFTYRFLRRTINGAQLFKYQRYKRNVGQVLYSFLILSSLTFAPASFFRGKYLKLRCFGEKL